MNVGAQDAQMGGVGTVERKATADLQAQQPVLRMTVEVTRAATGKVETYELIGTPIEERSE